MFFVMSGIKKSRPLPFVWFLRVVGFIAVHIIDKIIHIGNFDNQNQNGHTPHRSCDIYKR